LIAEKEQIREEKDEEIRKLKKNIDEMSSDFAEMLKDTLTKMQERIEFANKNWEDDTDANMLKKFDEIKP
jgi:gas vesicle protein